MMTEDLKNYILESFNSGKTKEEIISTLLKVSWPISDIEEALCIVQSQQKISFENQINKKIEIDFKNKKNINNSFRLSYIIFFIIIGILSGTIFLLLQDRINLNEINSKKTREFYTHIAKSQISFTNAGDMVFPDEQKFLTQKQEFILNKESFIDINLRDMKLVLYENGSQIKEMQILTKGKIGSWWETPTGNYKVLRKEVNHFSSIGKVWMPYSLQFYGNYFIHGWPYYDNGSPVLSSYSGGCIRLSNHDAETVFNFAKNNMPVLVLEDKETENFGTLKPKAKNASLPVISASAFLIFDIASSEIILEKNINKKLSIASLTKLMTAVVAHELIYLGRPIKALLQTPSNVYQSFQISEGHYYNGFDLLYPLLMQSSNDAAKTLASFLGEQNFVRDMNIKAKSLGVNDTHFDDSSGISSENTSTAYDISKLLQYIYYKRRFIFDISKGKEFNNVGFIKIGDTINIRDLKNFNEFSDAPNLIGMKNGETTAAGQTIATVWNFSASNGNIPVGIIILGSKDRVEDTKNLLKWFKNNFEILSD